MSIYFVIIFSWRITITRQVSLIYSQSLFLVFLIEQYISSGRRQEFYCRHPTC